jgi:hypothetical protein
MFVFSDSASIVSGGDVENTNDNDGKCIVDECVIHSLEECSRNKSCGIIEGICRQVRNGSLNGSVSGGVIGGLYFFFFFFFLFFIFYFYNNFFFFFFFF